MSGSLKLSFIIEAIDRATAPVRAVNDRIATLTEPARKVRASFNVLVNEAHLPRLGEQARTVMERFDGVTGALRGIGGAMLAVAGIGGAGAAIWLPLKHVIEAGSKINDTAAMLGVSAREFQRVAYALTLDGSSAEDAANSLRFLQKNAVEALTGNKEMAVWFRRAGMSAEFLKKNLNDPIALLNALSDAMAKNITPAQRVALSQALLGRGGARTAQTLSRGSVELKRLGDEAERLGTVMGEDTVKAMDESGDAILRMERSLGGIVTRITTAALPAIDKIVARITAWSVENRELIATKVTEFIDRLITNLPQIFDTTVRIAGAIGTLIVLVDRIAQLFGGWGVVATVIAGVLAGKLVLAIISLGSAIAAIIPTLTTLGVVLLTTPIGWFLGAVALLAGAAYLVYKHWEPIKQFFVDLWDTIKQALVGLDSVMPDWMKRFTLPGIAVHAAANAVRPTVPSALGAGGAPGGGQADVGGTIKIELDDNRARVTKIQSNAPGVDFDVDSGPMFLAMGGA